MEIDRVIVPDDEKKRVLDLSAMILPVPDVGIYDGELRWYAANVEWAKIIEGHVSWLASIAAWFEAEDENYHAIQQISIFLEGITVTLKEDIRDGMYEAFNRLALQIASGTFSNLNFSTDADGVVTQEPEGAADVPLPEDDPATDFDETEAAMYGSALAVSAGVNQFLAKLNSLYGVDATADTAIADAIQIIQFSYVTENSLDAAMTEYWTDRAASKAQITVLDREDLANAIYCNPYKETRDAVAGFIIELGIFNLEQKTNAVNCINSLEETQWRIWQNKGQALPSTEYFNSPCVPMKYQEILNIPYNTSRSLVPAQAKGGHRLDIIVGGYFVDPDGDTQDPFWYRTSAGVLTRSNFIFVNGAGANMPGDSQVPYSSTHEYRYTIDLDTGNNSWSVQFNRNANMNIASTSPTTGFYIKIKDLGQYTI